MSTFSRRKNTRERERETLFIIDNISTTTTKKKKKKKKKNDHEENSGGIVRTNSAVSALCF